LIDDWIDNIKHPQKTWFRKLVVVYQRLRDVHLSFSKRLGIQGSSADVQELLRQHSGPRSAAGNAGSNFETSPGNGRIPSYNGSFNGKIRF